ncbi:MAG: hypothetical protein HOV87_22485 [Catenulispora sp.]|nr:hypothetical protein [Catenulispora sp.]
MSVIPLALATTVALLACGTALVYPLEMDTIVTLAADRLIATHDGLYNTVCGLGITIGNLLIGSLYCWADQRGLKM